MAALTTNVVPLTGLQIDGLFTVADVAGDDCATGQGVLLLVKNGSAGALDVVLGTPQTVDGDLAVEDRTVSVPASGETSIPVTDRYRDPSTGRASITYPGGVTSLTRCVIRV